MTMSPARQLQIHLDMLGIDSSLGPHGVVSIVQPEQLLAYLADEEFIARRKHTAHIPEGLCQVPAHRTDNPVGALQEWATRRKVLASYTQSENIGTVHAPRFACASECDGYTVMTEASSKAIAKREAALGMLEKLAARYGNERP